MQIQVNSDRNIAGHEALAVRVRGVVESSLSHLGAHVTRVEVHLSDENSHKTSDNDKRCVMEVRLEGHPPIAVTHQAETVDYAVVGAAGKLRRVIERTLGRRKDKRRGLTDPPPAGLTD